MKKLIALNCAQKPNRGLAFVNDLSTYDRLTHESWLAKMVDDIRSGNDALKDELPIRCSHYYRFSDNRRRQADMDPEAFLFQTCVDIDDLEAVEPAIARAYILNNEEGGQWQNHLLHMEYSARKKLHIDIRIPVGMTIEEAQQAYTEALGVDYDSSCTSPERFILVTDARQEIYRSEHWYEVLPDEKLKVRREAYLKRGLTIDGRRLKSQPTSEAESKNRLGLEAQPKNRPGSVQIQQAELFPEMKPVEANEGCLRAFDLCMEEAGLTERALQIEGVRHNSLRSILSVGACQLMPKEQMLAVVKTRMPAYADEKDCQQLISDFYANYTELNRPLTRRQREIHAEAFGEQLEDVEPEEEVEAAEQPKKKHRLNVKALPSGLREPVMNAPKNMQMNVLSAIMPIAATYADQVSVRYADNKEQHLGLMGLIIGRQAGGKSSVKEAVELWMRPIKEQAREAREQEDAVKKKNKLRKANERAVEMPELVIRKVPITISCSTLLKRLKNAQGHTIYSFGEELDTLLKTNGAGSWSAKYDVYRYSFDRGEWGQDYNSDQAESGEVNVAYNWTILGTYGAFNRCFNGDNVENGLGGRVLMSEMPDMRFTKIPKYQPMTPEQEEAVLKAAELLQSKAGFIDTPLLRKHIDKWLEEKRLEALKNADEAMDELRKRSAVIAFRCAVVFHLLSGCERESRACIDFMLMMADYVLENQMHLLCEKMESQQAKNEPAVVKTFQNKSVYDKLPQVFTLKDVKNAKGMGLEDSSYRSIICKWKASGFIQEQPADPASADRKAHYVKLSA
ncbi:MAG: DUF3987 domain-containing protein [Prevotella sp.]|nr:DUF3987 domain-containing protein [Prevotella sp.]